MSYILNKLYSTLFYFELGRNTVARWYVWIPDLLIILGFAKLALGWNITWQITVLLIVLGFICFTVAGYMLKKWKWYDIDKKVQAGKDPVTNEIYTMAVDYNKNKDRFK